MIHITFTRAARGHRLEEFLEESLLEHSLGQIRKWVRLGHVRVNGHPATLETSLSEGDEVEIDARAETQPIHHAEAMELPTLLEGEGYLCLNKPAGVPVIPERHGRTATVIDGLLFQLEKRGITGVRPRIVHRLDKEASGVLLIALDAESERSLGMQFQKREVGKRYLALVSGEISADGSVDLSIGPDPKDVTRMVLSRGRGKPARTLYHPLERFRGFTLLEVVPETGRTHQIRIHLSAIGHTLAVDRLYGGGTTLRLSEIKREYRAKKHEAEKPLMSRLTLHAESLEFRDPRTGELKRASAPLPKDFTIALKMLRKYATAAGTTGEGAHEGDAAGNLR